MKDYRLNKTQLEHLREECLFAQGPIECENLKTFIYGLYTNGFISAINCPSVLSTTLILGLPQSS